MNNLILYLIINLALPIGVICMTIHIRNVSQDPVRRNELLKKYRSRSTEELYNKQKKLYSKRSAKAYTIGSSALVMYSLYKLSGLIVEMPAFVTLLIALVCLAGIAYAVYVYTCPHQKLRDQEW